MLWRICFYLAVLFCAAGFIVCLYMRKKGKSGILYLGTGVFLACVAVCFPVKCLEDAPGFAAAMSISHSIRMFVVDTGVDDITGPLSAKALGGYFYPYKTLVCLLYICAPTFTLGLVLRYFSDFFENFRLLLQSGKNLYIFSELNEHSISVAENIWGRCSEEGEKAAIVFCKSDKHDDVNCELEEKAKLLNAVFISREMERLHLRDDSRRISFFQISGNEGTNLDNTITMIEENASAKRKSSAYIYCFSTNTEAEILIDSKEKHDLKVILVDEIREAVYEQIFRYPLFSGIDPMKHSDLAGGGVSGTGGVQNKVLILGGGKTGVEFLKAAVWCGQMYRLGLEIHLIDVKGNLLLKKLKSEYPELIGEAGADSSYRVFIHKKNIFSSRMEELLDEIGAVSYCVCALGSEDDNVRAAVFLRRYFGRRYPDAAPLICAHIKSAQKRRAVFDMYEPARGQEKRLYYNIIAFGDSFENRTDTAFMKEYLGMGVHFHYCRIGENSTVEERRNAVKWYYSRQMNRRSSIANGIHMKYKLWELGLGILKVPKDEEQRQIFQTCVTPVDFLKETEERRNIYYELEHERWMAFQRSEGWSVASEGGSMTLADVKACYESYYAQFKNQNPMLKLHPALVPIHVSDAAGASLEGVEQMMKQMNEEGTYGSYDPQYVMSDVEVVDNIGNIVSGQWCGKGGILINGKCEKAGNYVLCRLEDAGFYYQCLYAQSVWKETEELLRLRNTIKYCYSGVLRQDNLSHEVRAEAYRALAFLAKEEIRVGKRKEYQMMAEQETAAASGKIRKVENV